MSPLSHPSSQANDLRSYLAWVNISQHDHYNRDLGTVLLLYHHHHQQSHCDHHNRDLVTLLALGMHSCHYLYHQALQGHQRHHQSHYNYHKGDLITLLEDALMPLPVSPRSPPSSSSSSLSSIIIIIIYPRSSMIYDVT